MTTLRLCAAAALGLATVGGCAAGAPDRSAACAVDYDARIAAELAEIDAGMAVYARGGEEADRTPEEQAALARTYELLAARDRPVNADDLHILDGALARLQDESSWDRDDDRECAPDDELVSLYCALEFATIDVIGERQHRRTALQEVRFALQEATADRDYDHRLRDFNNDPRTSLADVRAVIETARERVAARLARQADCAL